MIDLNEMRNLDVQELTVRVSRYGADLKTPEAYQAIAKPRDANRPAGVGVRGTPEAAALAALEEMEEGAAPSAPSKYGF